MAHSNHCFRPGSISPRGQSYAIFLTMLLGGEQLHGQKDIT